MLPLEGVRVLAVEQYGAGPFGTMFLADQGAEVIKIENPSDGGDMSRDVGPFFFEQHDSHFFHAFNRNKKSLTLDLSVPEGKEVLHDLVKSADALASNLRGDVPEKLGLTYTQLKAHNEKIVCAHLSAYGRTGPRAAWPGFDYLMQAEAGYFALTGEPGGPPARFGLSIVDLMTGLGLAYALLAALTGARQTGKGQDIDTPCQLYTSADGWIYIMCNKEKFWPALCEVLDHPEWADDPRFRRFANRLQHRDLITEMLDEVLSGQTTATWLRRFAGRVPAAPINDVAQALENPFVTENERLQTLEHPTRGSYRLVAPPVRSGESAPSRPAPRLGEHTEEILTGIGYDQARISRLRSAEII
jgi:crotonobetainyl-CoA:carnitine CoA-transferase CaiB-like acyl-CoA transferase